MKEIMKALELQRNGHHQQAAHIFRSEANKERPVKEKKELWKQADRAMKIHWSD